MDVWKTWCLITFSVIFTRAAFALSKKEPINLVGLFMGGFFCAIGGTAIGGIIGAIISWSLAYLVSSLSPLIVDMYQATVYGGIIGVIIGTVGGAIVGAIGGSRPGDRERIPRSIFLWLSNIALSLAFLVMGIGFTIVLGRLGGLAMYGALSALIQWYILTGELRRDDVRTLINFVVGFIVWITVVMVAESLGNIVIGAMGGVIVGIGQWFINGKGVKSSIFWWGFGCVMLGAGLGGLVNLVYIVF